MIELTGLSLRNFLSHTDTILRLDDYKGLVLIEGMNSSGHYSSNGSGKSSILEGIVYALTGETLRGVSVNDVVNRNYKKNTKVTLQFKKDNISYTVSRHRKDDTLGDSLVLCKDTEDISKRVNKETQKSLEDLLNISYKILISTILLGEGLSSRFTQLSDPEKKSLIESTLNLNYDISSIRTKANNKLSQYKLEKSNIEGRLSTLREVSSLDVEEVRRALNDQEAEAAKASAELEQLQGSLAVMKEHRDSLESKLSLLKVSMMQYDNYSAELQRLDTELATCLMELNAARTAEIPCCTICHQPLSSQESIKAFESNYAERIENINQRMSETRALLSAIPAKSLLEDKYNSLSEELRELDSNIEGTNIKLNQLSSDYWRINSTISQLNDSLEKHEDSISNISSLEVRESELSKEIEKYEYFYKLFSPTGIIVNILSDAIEYINSRLSTYSEVLLEKDYNISFLKGKISLVDSKGSSYQSLSNGEKRRLDISIQFALHDYVHMYCGSSVDTIFLDEVLDTLDDVGIENIITVLRLKLEYCKLSRIFVISHNSELKKYFDKVITVVKNEAGDSILYEN